MNVLIVTPAPPRSRKGNRITALRWARILRGLGHDVRVDQAYHGSKPRSRSLVDLLVALHARRSYQSVKRFAEETQSVEQKKQAGSRVRSGRKLPNRATAQRALIVALTGTDLYDDIQTGPRNWRNRHTVASMEWATRLVVLQPLAVERVPEHLRPKVRVIYQSVEHGRGIIYPRENYFDVCVVGHLRPVKDPFRAAKASRLLPYSSGIRIFQIGEALSPEMARRARAEENANPRYKWLGGLPHWEAMFRLRRSRLLVLSSKMEGGANVVSEAIAASVPVISSRIAGSIGLLGEDYPGYFPVGDTKALAALLRKAMRDQRFLRSLASHCRKRAHLFDPRRERRSWADLLDDLQAGSPA